MCLCVHILVYTGILTVVSIPSLISLSDPKVQYWSGSKKKYHLQVPWDQSDVFKPTNMSHFYLINAFTNNSTILSTSAEDFRDMIKSLPKCLSFAFVLGWGHRATAAAKHRALLFIPTCRPQETHLSAATNKDACSTSGFHQPLIRFPLFMYKTQMTSEEALLVGCVGHRRERLLMMTICVTFTSCIPLA